MNDTPQQERRAENAPNRPEDAGLTDKYEVRKDGEPQEGCFVLKPESDEAALEALKTYAKETDEPFLAADLSKWIANIERENLGDRQ